MIPSAATYSRSLPASSKRSHCSAEAFSNTDHTTLFPDAGVAGRIFQVPAPFVLGRFGIGANGFGKGKLPVLNLKTSPRNHLLRSSPLFNPCFQCKGDVVRRVIERRIEGRTSLPEIRNSRAAATVLQSGNKEQRQELFGLWPSHAFDHAVVVVDRGQR